MQSCFVCIFSVTLWWWKWIDETANCSIWVCCGVDAIRRRLNIYIDLINNISLLFVVFELYPLSHDISFTQRRRIRMHNVVDLVKFQIHFVSRFGFQRAFRANNHQKCTHDDHISSCIARTGAMSIESDRRDRGKEDTKIANKAFCSQVKDDVDDDKRYTCFVALCASGKTCFSIQTIF